MPITAWPPSVSQTTFDAMCRDARDFSLSHGLVMRSDNEPNDNIVLQMPITLLPTPFPRRLYECAKAIQTYVNELMYKIAIDRDFMRESLKDVMKVDEFTRKLFELNEMIEREGRSQPIVGCISRSDYMLHATKCDYDVDGQVPKCRIGLRQVEVNAIAASLSSSSMVASKMHQYLLQKYFCKNQKENDWIKLRCPPNEGSQLVVDSLIKAWDLYGKPGAQILVVTENRSINFADQRITELMIQDQRLDIATIRCRFIDLLDCISLGPNQELFLNKSIEIAVVYFRFCYDPSDYQFDGAWDVRLRLERSRAIKFPSSNFHLSGVKKFQQILNDQVQLEKFLDEDSALKLSRVFCRLWSLDFDEDGQAAFDMVMRHGMKQSLVLKPQREGGGHNIYGEAIKPFLQNIQSSDARSQYILMEYINSPTSQNWMLTYNNSPCVDKNDMMIGELGIYGCMLADNTRLLVSETENDDNKKDIIKSKLEKPINETGGYLVRSKKFGVDEGGVAAGYSCMSSLYLVDDELGDDAVTDGYFSV